MSKFLCSIKYICLDDIGGSDKHRPTVLHMHKLKLKNRLAYSKLKHLLHVQSVTLHPLVSVPQLRHTVTAIWFHKLSPS